MLTRVLSLAFLTFKEGVRDRALFGIGLFCMVMMGSTLVVISLFMRELHKVTVDINLSVIAFAGLMMTFFLSINLLAKDIDKHTIYCVLSKPISRTEYIVGKYFGIVILILSAFILLTVCSIITIFIIKIQFEQWFVSFQWSGFYKAVFSNFLMVCLLNAMVVFFSTITTSSFITLLFSITTYIAGQTIEEVVFYLSTKPDIVMTKAIESTINIVQYILPNLALFDLKIQAAHSIFVSWKYLGAIFCYAIVYCSLLLIFSAMIFNRRELV